MLPVRHASVDTVFMYLHYLEKITRTFPGDPTILRRKTRDTKTNYILLRNPSKVQNNIVFPVKIEHVPPSPEKKEKKIQLVETDITRKSQTTLEQVKFGGSCCRVMVHEYDIQATLN